MNFFKGKTVLITGAFGGFGKHFTTQLASSGANLILTDLAIPSEQNETRVENCLVERIKADLSTSEGCMDLYDKVTKPAKYPDVIIHNAGIGYGGAYVDVPLAKNEKVIDLNLLAPMRLNSLFLPQLIKKRSGQLIYVSSVAGFVATSYDASYSTSKFGLRALAMAVHGEVKRYGIKTSIVYPFYTKTQILKSQVFGDPMKTMPDFFAGDPANVVRIALRGASKFKLHICPGFISKIIWQAAKFVPIIGDQRQL